MNRLAALALAVALGPACGKAVTYSYFVIDVKIDPTSVDDSLLNRIAACAANAQTSLRTDSADLRCTRYHVGYDLGKFEYTTTLTSGAVTFSVVANDFSQTTLARGEVGPLDIVVGGKVTGSILVKAVPGAVPDADLGGAADAGAPDAGTD